MREEEQLAIAKGISTLVDYDRGRLEAFASWLWSKGAGRVTVDSLAKDCDAIDASQASLAYRLLIRSGALHEARPGQGARINTPCLIALVLDAGNLISATDTLSAAHAELVWTLPDGLDIPAAFRGQRSIADLMRSVISSAQERIWLVSPFIDEAGIEQILEATVSALRRGISVKIITHYLQDIASPNSRAVERLRREASATKGQFQAYSARERPVDHRSAHPLLHAKVAVADGKRAYVGTANLTGYGLRTHLEIGVSLGRPQAEDIELLLRRLLTSELVEEVFSC